MPHPTTELVLRLYHDLLLDCQAEAWSGITGDHLKFARQLIEALRSDREPGPALQLTFDKLETEARLADGRLDVGDTRRRLPPWVKRFWNVRAKTDWENFRLLEEAFQNYHQSPNAQTLDRFRARRAVCVISQPQVPRLRRILVTVGLIILAGALGLGLSAWWFGWI